MTQEGNWGGGHPAGHPAGIDGTSGNIGRYVARLLRSSFSSCLRVIARYVVTARLTGPEFAIYGQVLLVALTAAYVLREEGHVPSARDRAIFRENATMCRLRQLDHRCSLLHRPFHPGLEHRRWSYSEDRKRYRGVPLAPQFILSEGWSCSA